MSSGRPSLCGLIDLAEDEYKTKTLRDFGPYSPAVRKVACEYDMRPNSIVFLIGRSRRLRAVWMDHDSNLWVLMVEHDDHNLSVEIAISETLAKKWAARNKEVKRAFLDYRAKSVRKQEWRKRRAARLREEGKKGKRRKKSR